MSARRLQLAPTSPVQTGDRGPWLDAKQIAERFFDNRVSPRWVCDHVALESRKKIGRFFLWREQSVVEWIVAQEPETPAAVPLVTEPSQRPAVAVLSLHSESLDQYLQRHAAKGNMPVLNAKVDRRRIVYGLVSPKQPQRIRYVGTTRNHMLRYLSHCAKRRGPIGRWVRSLSRSGLTPMMICIQDISDVSDRGGTTEWGWIEYFRAHGQADLNIAVPAIVPNEEANA